jgi:hypothetical protein
MVHLEVGDITRLRQMLILAEQGSEQESIAAFLLVRHMMMKKQLNFIELLKSHSELLVSVCEVTYTRLCKVLRLSISDKEGESIAAFLMARRMMERLRLKFDNIMKFDCIAPSEIYAKCYPTVELEIIALQKKVRELNEQLQEKDRKLQMYEKAFESVLEGALTTEAMYGQRLLSEPSLPH